MDEGREYEEKNPIDLIALERLKREHVLALITNGHSHLDRAGIENYFRHIILGEKYAYKKPDRRLFEELISMAGISSQEMIHVGDSLKDDVEGANRAGLNSVWLNREGRENDSGIRPDFQIECLEEILNVLECLNAV